MFADIEAAEIISSAVQSAAETDAAYTAGLDAVDRGELTYDPGSRDKPPHLKRHKVDDPCLPVDRQGLNRWKQRIKPMLSRLLSYAYRLSIVSEREHQVQLRSEDLDVEAQAIQRVAERQSLALRETGVSSGPEITDAQLIKRQQLRLHPPRNGQIGQR
jgi:hypothetical protein